MDLKKLPIGIDDFKKIIENKFYYVDKTALIGEVLRDWGEVNLFTRPRRFGKTLNMSMFRYFLEIGTDKSLFDGLEISKHKEICDKYMGQFPVVFVSLKTVDGLTFEEAFVKVRELLCDEAQNIIQKIDVQKIPSFDFEYLNALAHNDLSNIDLSGVLKRFSNIYSEYYNKQCVIIIDEYDVPLNKAFEQGYYDEMMNFVRGMFNGALKTNENLQFAIMTGCLRISKESIFTGLNNPHVFSIMDTSFDEYFGFTDAEVVKLLEDYGLSEHHAEMQKWYDGYRFGNQEVYCPWDVICYAYDLKGNKDAYPKPYWINAGNNSMVRALIEKSNSATLRAEVEKLIAGQSVTKRIDDQITHNEVYENVENLWSVLYLSGYLTTAMRATDEHFDLIIPNEEVRRIFVYQVMEWIKHTASTKQDVLQTLYTAIQSGDTDTMQKVVNTQLRQTISFYDANENFYHGFMIALLNLAQNWNVISNREMGRGRSDILIEDVDNEHGYVLELKATKDRRKLSELANSALQQIVDKNYTQILTENYVENIWIYGVAFCKKECVIQGKQLEV